MNDEYTKRCRQHYKMNPETINDMCKKAERMKQHPRANLTGGYYKAGYENVKISEVKDYFLIHGKNNSNPDVYRSLQEVEQYINSLTSEKHKSRIVIVPFSVSEETFDREIYDIIHFVYDRLQPQEYTKWKMGESSILHWGIIQRYKERYYSDREEVLKRRAMRRL